MLCLGSLRNLGNEKGRAPVQTGAGKFRIMLDSRELLAYIRLLQVGRPRLPAGLGTVHEARHAKGLQPRESLATGHVCLRLPTSRSDRIDPSTEATGGDDGGHSSAHHWRCVRAGKDHRTLLPTCPRRGGAAPACQGVCRAGDGPDGNHLVRPRSRQGTSSTQYVWARAAWHAAADSAVVDPRGRDEGFLDSRRPALVSSAGPQVSTARRRRPRDLAQPSAAVQEGDKR
jgi:hypothetical protein